MKCRGRTALEPQPWNITILKGSPKKATHILWPGKILPLHFSCHLSVAKVDTYESEKDPYTNMAGTSSASSLFTYKHTSDCTSGASTCTSPGCSLKWKARHQQSTMIKTTLSAKELWLIYGSGHECWNINLAATTCAMNEVQRKGKTAQNIAQRVSYMHYRPATWVQV